MPSLIQRHFHSCVAPSCLLLAILTGSKYTHPEHYSLHLLSATTLPQALCNPGRSLATRHRYASYGRMARVSGISGWHDNSQTRRDRTVSRRNLCHSSHGCQAWPKCLTIACRRRFGLAEFRLRHILSLYRPLSFVANSGLSNINCFLKPQQTQAKSGCIFGCFVW